METGVERVYGSGYTRIFAEGKLEAEIKRVTAQLCAEGKEITSIQQEQPFPGVVLWSVHANISWRKPDPVVEQQPVQQVVAQPQISISSNATIESLIKRVYTFLEDKEYDKANAYCENILDQDPECAEAYLCLLLAELKISNIAELAKYYRTIKDNKNYLRAKKFASDDLKVAIKAIEEESEIIAQRTSQNSNTCNIEDFEIIDGVLKKYVGTGEQIIIPDIVTIIGDKAFEYCRTIKRVTITNSVKSIGEYAFSSCDNLYCAEIGDSVQSIGQYAFSCCLSLKTIYIHGLDTTIGEKAFFGCDNLTLINAKEEMKEKVKETIKRKESVDENKSSSGGCYVATAVYGSYDCPEVWTLRRFRDYSLALTWYGRLFIALYYAISPTIVKWFGNTKWFNKMWKGRLDKMVKRLQEQGFENTPYSDRKW